jgi:CHASE3 domain sensor protein
MGKSSGGSSLRFIIVGAIILFLVLFVFGKTPGNNTTHEEAADSHEIESAIDNVVGAANKAAAKSINDAASAIENANHE